MLVRILSLFANSWSSDTRSSARSHRRTGIVLEALEDRTVPATLNSFPALASSLLAASSQVESNRTVTPRIINGSPTSDFSSVGLVGDRNGFFCSGTLIDDDWVLTAGHCGEGVSNTSGRFKIGGQTYSTSMVVVNANYNPNRLGEDSANDVALYHLDQAVSGITPSPIFRGTPHVGDLLTLVGFGAGGTGSHGSNGDFGTKRVGTTPIDGVSSKLITWVFEDNANNESNTAPGDSGGPAYLLVNNVYQVAGVTSGGSRANAGFGDHSFDTRVDAFANWIDDQIANGGGGGGPDDHGNTFGDATEITLTGALQGSATGEIGESFDVDMFKFVANRAGTATITLWATSDGMDPILTVFNSNGEQLARNDDAVGLSSRVHVKLKSGSTYYLQASAYHDVTGTYDVELKRQSARHGRSALLADDTTPLTAKSSMTNDALAYWLLAKKKDHSD